ncbi:MAG: teicoplanin resistance protein VanZ [Variovorax sp.]|nr:teicoplanin resistance protein VanZ [Variovorax sp.]
MAPRKTTALPLALSYAALIVYASLYPFADWRDQGLAPWAFLAAPLPKYWTGFDLAINVAGYMPLGFLCALAVLRARPDMAVLPVVVRATLAGVAISLAMETLQSYLPARIPSNVDLALNAGGALAGALLAGALKCLGAMAHWDRLRGSWAVEYSMTLSAGMPVAGRLLVTRPSV